MGLMRTALTVAAALCLSAFSGCGGGGKVQISGLWVGPSFALAISESGETWGYYIDPELAPAAQTVVLTGRTNAAAEVVAGEYRAYQPTSGQAVGFFGTAIEAVSITGNLDVCCSTGTRNRRLINVSAKAVQGLNPAAMLSQAVGQYAIGSTVRLTVNESGNIAGSDGGCLFTGTLRQAANTEPFLRVSLTFADTTDCLYRNKTVAGAAVILNGERFIAVTDGSTGLAYRF